MVIITKSHYFYVYYLNVHDLFIVICLITKAHFKLDNSRLSVRHTSFINTPFFQQTAI